MEKVGVGHAFRAVDLRFVVHATEFCPAFFGYRHNLIFEFQDEDRIIIAPCLILVDVSTHLCARGGVEAFAARSDGARRLS